MYTHIHTHTHSAHCRSLFHSKLTKFSLETTERNASIYSVDQFLLSLPASRLGYTRWREVKLIHYRSGRREGQPAFYCSHHNVGLLSLYRPWNPQPSALPADNISRVPRKRGAYVQNSALYRRVDSVIGPRIYVSQKKTFWHIHKRHFWWKFEVCSHISLSFSYIPIMIVTTNMFHSEFLRVHLIILKIIDTFFNLENQRARVSKLKRKISLI